MGDRTRTRTAGADAAAAPPVDETLEEALEDALDQAPEDEAGELEEVVDEALAEEPEEEEEEAERAEAAIEAELEVEDETAINEDAVLDLLLRRTGVLPEENEAGGINETAELPAPRHENEFVCSVCFLIKPRSQLGDPVRRVCRDCLDPPGATPASA
jgi:hypothetical protein